MTFTINRHPGYWCLAVFLILFGLTFFGIAIPGKTPGILASCRHQNAGNGLAMLFLPTRRWISLRRAARRVRRLYLKPLEEL